MEIDANSGARVRQGAAKRAMELLERINRPQCFGVESVSPNHDRAAWLERARRGMFVPPDQERPGAALEFETMSKIVETRNAVLDLHSRLAAVEQMLRFLVEQVADQGGE